MPNIILRRRVWPQSSKWYFGNSGKKGAKKTANTGLKLIQDEAGGRSKQERLASMHKTEAFSSVDAGGRSRVAG